MQELILSGVMVIAFVCIVSAYGMGVRHGLSVSKGIAPKPIISAPQVKQEPKTEHDDIIPLLMAYSYETAISGIKKEMTHG